MQTTLMTLVGGLALSCAVLAAPAPRAAPRAASAATAEAPAGKGLPTSGQVRELFEQGDYAQAIKQATTALAARGADAVAGNQRHDLLVLKGEAQLKLKNLNAAAAAFDEAERFAPDGVAGETAAVDRSTAELFRRSKGGTYTPPVRKGAAAPAPLDVSEPAARKAAFAAMFEEARPKVAAAVKSASLARQLPALLDAAKMLRDLRALELASSGETKETGKIAADLTPRARSLMARAVGDMADTVQKLEAKAMQVYNQVTPAGGGMRAAESGAVGLTIDETSRVRRIAGDCSRVAGVASDLKALFPADEADALRTLRDDADAVARHATQLADTRWDDYRAADEYVDPNAGGPPPPPPRGGTNFVQRPAGTGRNGPPSNVSRGVGTGGPR